VRLTSNANRVRVTVQDDGIGIRPEAHPRIFDPFYTTKRPGGGTGLGLSICMSIIREHGGNIEAETLPAGGTAFTVSLPIAVGQPPEPLPAPADVRDVPREPVRPAAELLKDRTVLVLDDEESIRMLLDEGLSAQGLQVDCVATVEEALTHLNRSPYDVLLCDLHLSSGGFAVDGRDAARRILETVGTPKPAVIFMTGDLIEGGEDAAKRDLHFCLQKPFRISEVLAMLREVLAAAPAETRHS
jgi:CheY-like chemotaxis protein